MKKLFLLMSLMATTSIAMATDLWEGTHAVDWSKTLTIEAAKFAEAACCQAHATPTFSMPTSTKWKCSSPRECLPV